jgi:hypothetical protein
MKAHLKKHFMMYLLISAALIFTLIALFVILQPEVKVDGVSVSSELPPITLKPNSDTNVKKPYSTKNYGSEKEVISDGDPIVQSLLKFDLSSISKTNISKIELIITPKLSRDLDKKILTTNPEWDEAKVTWDTKPGVVEQVGSFKGKATSSAAVTISLDVNKILARGNTLSLLIDDTSGGETLEFNSRESSGGSAAVLKVSYTTPIATQPPPAVQPPVVQPVPTPNPTPIPDSTPEPAPSPTPTPNPVPTTSGSGIWISSEEIAKLPMSGGAWDRLLTAANSDWGSSALDDNNSKHDVLTLAGALVAVRKNDNAMREKTISALKSAVNSPLSRTLELSRGLQTYIIAADIINYHESDFENWVRAKVNDTSVSPHNGGSIVCNSSGAKLDCNGIGGIVCTAVKSPNNWGGHARASLAAAALYLNDSKMKQDVVNAHKAFIGLPVKNNLHCVNTNWHPDSTNRVGVNPKGSTVQGQDVSGVLPEDWRRGSTYKWPPTLTGYMWEGMQGYVVTAVILHRAGLVSFNSGDDAVVRSMNQLYSINYPPVTDDTWIPWVVNYYGGTSFETETANPGKNMGWTDWTMQR